MTDDSLLDEVLAERDGHEETPTSLSDDGHSRSASTEESDAAVGSPAESGSAPVGPLRDPERAASDTSSGAVEVGASPAGRAKRPAPDDYPFFKPDFKKPPKERRRK